jgi:hypothetical protein
MILSVMTPERIPRHDDDKLYQPKIHSRWIRELYQIKLETGEPMTVLLEQALTEYMRRRKEPAAGNEPAERLRDQDSCPHQEPTNL